MYEILLARCANTYNEVDIRQPLMQSAEQTENEIETADGIWLIAQHTAEQSGWALEAFEVFC